MNMKEKLEQLRAVFAENGGRGVELAEQIDRLQDLLDFRELEEKINVLEEQLSRSVTWSVEDFEQQARQIELMCSPHRFGYYKLYDRSKFPMALREMIRRHDACVGITWDTVDFWLNELCVKEEPKDDLSKESTSDCG